MTRRTRRQARETPTSKGNMLKQFSEEDQCLYNSLFPGEAVNQCGRTVHQDGSITLDDEWFER